MSRQHSYSYEIDNPTEEQLDLWETTIDDHLDLYPEAVCHGGGAGSEQLSVWLWCNKTKSRLYKQRLDQVFGTNGRMVNLDDRWIKVDGEWVERDDL